MENPPKPVRKNTHAPSADGGALLADRPLGEVIESVASDEISPGAGAAGAVALALAAACAGKAVAITLKRHRDDASLLRARDRLASISHRALRGAEDDASRFKDFVHAKDAETAERLISAGERLRHLAAELDDVLGEIEARVDQAVTSDVTAARTLGRAFAVIQTVNLDDNRRAAEHVKLNSAESAPSE